MINLRYSVDLDKSIDIVPDLMNIEKKVYVPEYCGEYESIQARYCKNRDTFILAYDDDKMIGYLCFLPISQRLYNELINTETFHDDDISPDDIENYHDGVNLYLLSIAILPEYQNSDVIIKMTSEFSNFVKNKEENGIKFNNIVASAVSEDGEKLLSHLGFNKIKTVEDQYVLYGYNQELINDVYIMIPVDISNRKNIDEAIEVPDYVQVYLDEMRKNSEYECDERITNTIDREYLGSFSFAFMDDTYTRIIRTISTDLVLTLHKSTNLGLLSLFFKENLHDMSQIEDQMSSNHLYLLINDKPVKVCDFIKDRFGFNKCGNEKILICLNKRPDTELKLCYLLAAEAYNSLQVNYKINSPEIIEAARNNIAEYDFYELYVSDNCLVYISDQISDNYIENILIEKAIIFICEIVMLQNSAISRTNQRIVDELTSNIDISLKTIERMHVEFGHTILLWDKNIFNYTLAQKLANKIYAAFGNEELLEEYNKNQDYIEHIIELRSTLNSDREGKILNVLAFILSISELVQILVSVFGFIKDFDLKILVAGGIGVGTTTLLLIFILLLRRHRRNRKRH